MTAYWINTFTAIHDEARLARYVELAGPAMRAAGGVFLARGNPVHVLEGSLLCAQPSSASIAPMPQSRHTAAVHTRRHSRSSATAPNATFAF
jgi:uncharacterized protein (DUF1330 family)